MLREGSGRLSDRADRPQREVVASLVSRAAPAGLAIVAAALVSGGCGSATRGTGGETKEAIAIRFVRLLASPRWRDALDLEQAGVGGPGRGSLERGLHDSIRALGLRRVGRPTHAGRAVRQVLRGRQRLRVKRVFVGTRYSRLVLTLSFARTGDGWRVAGLEYSQGGRIVPPARGWEPRS